MTLWRRSSCIRVVELERLLLVLRALNQEDGQFRDELDGPHPLDLLGADDPLITPKIPFAKPFDEFAELAFTLGVTQLLRRQLTTYLFMRTKMSLMSFSS